jgi:ATP-dependent Clp protease ATP-binding subunit ClpA
VNNFDPYSQQALALARKEADKFSTFYVGNEHLLLGILGLPNCTGVSVLQRLGVDIELLKGEVIAGMPTPGPKPSGGNIPYTPEVKKALALANKEANQMSAGFVGTEHLLLGMLRINSGTVFEALIHQSVSLATLRDAVRLILGLTALPAEDVTTAVIDTSLTGALNFTMWIDPGDSSVEDVKELFMAASDLHRSFGGKGLLFVKDEQQKPMLPCPN